MTGRGSARVVVAVLTGDERQRGGQHRAEQCPQGVGDEVVDVEDPIGAGVGEPVPGQLGQLDEQRHGELDRGRSHYPGTTEVAHERAERYEERDVEDRLLQGRVA